MLMPRLASLIPALFVLGCAAQGVPDSDEPPPLGSALITEMPGTATAFGKADGLCEFDCAEYGYRQGLCHGGWLCDAGCITYTECTESLPEEEDPIDDGEVTEGGACPSLECADADCGELVQMPGSQDPASERALSDGYYIATERRYSYLRKDLIQVLRYATCMVARKFPGTAPLGISDLSQADGLTPGVDADRARHPTSTHRGNDMDLAYYQTDGSNNPQIVCGDGSDRNGNGREGSYNDGYFCTSDENIVDWPRQNYFFAMMAAVENTRVFGVDTTFVDELRSGLSDLKDAGEIDEAQASRATHLGHGSEGGWAFHHHHSHMSYR